MFRFVALIWNDHNERSHRRAQALLRRAMSHHSRWKVVFTSRGIVVLAADPTVASRALVIKENGGVVLGTLFPDIPVDDPGHAVMIKELDDAQSREIVSSLGARLADRFWGRFVAFLKDHDSGDVRCVRAPVSNIPCSVTEIDEVIVLASKLTDLVSISHQKPAIDWTQLAIRVATSLDRMQCSLLSGISTIFPGECVVFRDGRQFSRSFYWHPESVATTKPIDDLEVATKQLATVGRQCVGSWASCYTSIVHLLSGGFDSSVVATLLGMLIPPPSVRCLNLRTSENASDERHYARLVAQAAGFLLEEQLRTGDVDMEDLFLATPDVAPCFALDSLEQGPLIRAACETGAAQAVFNGQHGDTLFFSAPARFAAIDLARRTYGASFTLLRLLMKIRRYSKDSFWTLLLETGHLGVARRPWNPRNYLLNEKPNTLTTDHANELALRSAHTMTPWFTDGSSLPPGKLSHAWLLFAPTSYYDPFYQSGDAERTEPLLARPIADLCLRIASYVHSFDGRPRAAARRAFAPYLPVDVAQRQWKSGTGVHMECMLSRHTEWARDLLLNGVLVREKLIDKAVVETSLGKAGHGKRTAKLAHLFLAICTEVWAQTVVRVADASPGRRGLSQL